MAILPSSDPATTVNFTTQLLNGGPIILHLRDKNAEGKSLYDTSQMLKLLVNNRNIHIYINSRADIASATGLSGLHLPENSPSCHHFRSLCPSHLKIGVSVHSIEKAIEVEMQDADYLVFGPIFNTPGKTAFQKGIRMLEELCQHVKIPIYAIGGINPERTVECLKAGAYGVALCSYLFESEYPEKQAMQIQEKLSC